MAGGHDVLVAGRPQYVFPGQQLLVVGRLETSCRDVGRSEKRAKEPVDRRPRYRGPSAAPGLHPATRQGHADHQREDGPGARLGTGGAHVWPGGHQPVGRRVRRGRGGRTGGHGLRPALPRDGPDLFALDARIGAGLRPLQYQAGRRQLRGQGPACRPDRRQDHGRSDRGHERSQSAFPGLVSPGPRVLGGPFRSAGLAGCRPGGPAGRDVRRDRRRRCNASCGSARICRKTCGSRGSRACRTTKRWPPRPSGD